MTVQMESSFLSRVCQIVVVGHNHDAHQHIANEIASEGFEVLYRHPDELQLVLESEWIDLVLLDPTIPQATALALCRIIRRRSNRALVPIMVISSNNEEESMVDTLRAGADEFLEVGTRQAAIAARLKTLIRRHAAMEQACGSTRPVDNVLQVGGITIKLDEYEVLINGHRVHLTLSEFRLLSLLASRPKASFTREQIIRALEGEDAAVTTETSGRALDTRVYTLRRRLGPLGRYIRTVRGVGFKLEVR